MKRLGVSIAVLGLLAGSATVVHAAAPRPAQRHGLRAGVAVVDATWHVGASAGQYTDYPDPTDPARAEWDPQLQHVTKKASYGVASRLDMRALVLQSGDEAPVAIVKDDNYLAQDMLTRRTAQLLAADGSRVTYDHILVSATHDHSSPYYSTPSWGVWLFQDVMDLRMFEYQARRMALAIETAERRMRPARMGATTVQAPQFQGNIAGADVNEDGTPTGYPLQDNDHGLVVMRFDDVTEPARPRPLATWVNYAQHGESLDSYDLISADWLAPFQRYVDRATGAPTVFAQGAVGSAEGPYEHAYPKGGAPTVDDGGEPVPEVWAHMGYAQAERGAHLLAGRAVAAWRAIGGERNGVAVQVPYSSDPPVRMLTHWVPGPLSHPYPSVSNCRTANTVDGDPGAPVLGLPDCERAGTGAPLSPLYANLKAAGLPLPDNYDAAAFTGVEEDLRLKLQAVRIGDVLLASCACEPQSDLVRALETRTDRTQHNRWNGFDYADPAHVREGWPAADPPVAPCHPVTGGSYDCPDPRDVDGRRRLTVTRAAFAHMQAELNNPADGWDDPAYAAQAGSEPADPAAVKGNFTARELSPRCGYALPVGLGHTGDYNGYTVSYREYMARDAYRKALTSYGPHTADYMVTRLMAMAADLRCGTPLPPEPLDPLAAADEARAQAAALALGRLASAYYDGWDAQQPDDVGPAAVLDEPAATVRRFSAATFTWRGGSNWTDDPTVRVERRGADGGWAPYADQSGEVQTVLALPPGVRDLLTTRTGTQEWRWTASFEVFDAYPRSDVPGGQVPDGTYRFVVDGAIHVGGRATAYHLRSRPFTVAPWTGLTGRDLRVGPDGSVSFTTDPVVYPRTYRSPVAFVHDDGGGRPGADSVLCKTCTFRPWATRGAVVSAVVTVLDAQGKAVRAVPAHQVDGRWVADAHLAPGESAVVLPGGLRDAYGETNAAPLPTGTAFLPTGTL